MEGAAERARLLYICALTYGCVCVFMYVPRSFFELRDSQPLCMYVCMLPLFYCYNIISLLIEQRLCASARFPRLLPSLRSTVS